MYDVKRQKHLQGVTLLVKWKVRSWIQNPMDVCNVPKKKSSRNTVVLIIKKSYKWMT